jgi:hypothetical protein
MQTKKVTTTAGGRTQKARRAAFSRRRTVKRTTQKRIAEAIAVRIGDTNQARTMGTIP